MTYDLLIRDGRVVLPGTDGVPVDIAIHDGADHFHFTPHIHVQAGIIRHDLKRRRDTEDKSDRHLSSAHGAVFVHHDV